MFDTSATAALGKLVTCTTDVMLYADPAHSRLEALGSRKSTQQYYGLESDPTEYLSPFPGFLLMTYRTLLRGRNVDVEVSLPSDASHHDIDP